MDTGSFYLLTVVNDAAANMGVQVFLGDQVTLLSRCAGNSDSCLSASQDGFKGQVVNVWNDL